MLGALESVLESMRFFHFESLPSTQTYAVRELKRFCELSESRQAGQAGRDYKALLDDCKAPLDSENSESSLIPPFCIRAVRQSEGIGSRGNGWESVPNALCFSFVLPLSALPRDLRLESSSIFFGVIMQRFLLSLGSSAWLKYPNDVYVGENKVGGILTQKVRDYLVCGIGLNLYELDSETLAKCGEMSAQGSTRHTLEPIIALDTRCDEACEGFLREFFKTFEKFHSWKQIFSIYQLEFRKNNAYFFHHGEERICLKDATLNEDGSLSVGGQRIYSLR